MPASLHIDQNRSLSGRNGEVCIEGPVLVWMTLGTSMRMIRSSWSTAASGSAKEMNGGV